MKASTKDQIKGKFHETKGKVKEKAGRATRDPNLEAEGQAKSRRKQIERVFEK